MQRLWLIARREIVAYTGVASFWVALLIGPLLMGLATLGATLQTPPAPPAAPAVQVVAARADLAEAAAAALKSTGVRPVDAAQHPATRLVLAAQGDTATLRIEGAPLPDPAVQAVAGALRAALGDERLAAAGVSRALIAEAHAVSVSIEHIAPAPAPPPVDAGRLGRYGVAMLLWLALIGSLGMLLQAVVRERSHRALESLMSAARPVEIIGGKLLGVGLVSLIVLGGWLGSGALAAVVAHGAGGQMLGVVIRAAFGDPLWLAFALAVYVLAFAMYGAALVGVGVLARDVAAAQNLSRPVFGVLLIVFFTALTQLTGGHALSGALAWLPPVTPFALLVTAPAELGAGQMLGGMALMAAVTAAGLWLAGRLLARQVDCGDRRRRRRREPVQAAAAAA